jgi:hypothetical protein
MSVLKMRHMVERPGKGNRTGVYQITANGLQHFKHLEESL